MSLHVMVLFVHVASAVALLSGSIVASPAVRAAARRAGTVEEIRTCLGMGRSLLLLEPISSLVVLASGAFLTTRLHFWGFAWVQVATVFWGVNAVVAVLLVKPATEQVAREVIGTSVASVPARLDDLRWSWRWSLGGDVLLANDAAMLFLMVVRPGLPGSLLSVAVANAAVLALRVGAGRRRLRGPAAGEAEGGSRTAAPYVQAAGWSVSGARPGL